LNGTSSIPKRGHRLATQQRAFRCGNRLETQAKVETHQRKLVRTLSVVALAGLMGLTSWVVALVSSWLVPVYATVMVLIFILPRARWLEPEEQEGSDYALGVDTKGTWGARLSADVRTDTRPQTKLGIGGHTEVTASTSESSISPVTRPGRARGYGKRPARTTAETAIATAPVAWIQVAPGKFVRADSQDQVLTSGNDPASSAGRIPALATVTCALSDAMEEANAAALPVSVEETTSADLIKAQRVAEDERPQEKQHPVTNADPETDYSTVRCALPEVEADQGEIPTTPPDSAATFETLSRGSIGSDPVVEEHGIAPSIFGRDLPGALLLDRSYWQEPTSLPDKAATSGTTPGRGETDPTTNSMASGIVLVRLKAPGPASGGVRLVPNRTRRSVLSRQARPRLGQRCWGTGIGPRYVRAFTQIVRTTRRSQRQARCCSARPVQAYRTFLPRSPPVR
jgi:hypothetical protein